MQPIIEFAPVGPVNRRAVISAVAALLAALALALDLIPVPLTFLVCYPTSVLLAIIALVTGIAALIQIRITGEAGRGLAWIGLGVGGVTILAAACALAVGIALWPHVRSLVEQFWARVWP